MLKPKRSIVLLFKEIHEGNELAFNELFLAYYDRLVSFSMTYVKQQEHAEELTSELFVKLWLKRDTLTGILKPEVYLYIAVKNAALNHLRGHKKSTRLWIDDEENTLMQESGQDKTELETKELSRKLDEAIAALPEQRRIIFRLIKEEELKCREVAGILNISVRTVENQLYKAVKTLADAISPYLGYHPQKRSGKKQVLSKLSVLFFL
ncbi:RNA polymerase sigma-70 factor [Pedobacter heparinus]|uniref:RNA polymerase sigma-70 factor n=1 Tax=Pedobacter heparinus TaxID=984 RepID=UPI00293051B0|nr:RNA polymerase sigma-70 factor [Pedobacter heparinus]